MCIYLFFGLLAYVLFFGGKTGYIIDTGIQSMGRMIQHFIELSTFTDPERKTMFPQNYTIYYWAYWMVWCVAAPFFIGTISRGRTVRQTIVGGYVFGAGSTIISFIILGNYSLGKELVDGIPLIKSYTENGDLYNLIINIVKTLPGSTIVFIVLILTMVAFYATSFDSIAYIASCYSYRRLKDGESPIRMIQLMWCLLLIVLPIALLFSESSMSNIQSVSIIAAFPIAAVITLIAASFLKDAGAFMSGLKAGTGRNHVPTDRNKIKEDTSDISEK